MQKNIRRYAFWIGSVIVALLAVVIFVLVPIDTSVDSNNRVQNLYYVDNISEAHQELIDRFNRENEGSVQVIPVNLPFSKFSTNERKEILARSLRSKSERIDIFAVDVIWGPRFARWSYPLDVYFKENDLDHLNRHALASCYWKGRLIALPFYADIGLMYYRRDILEQLPDYPQLRQKLKESICWDEFIELGRRLRYLKKPFFLYPGDSYEGLMCAYQEALEYGEGRKLFARDSVNLNTSQARGGLQLLHDFIYDWNLTPGEITRFDEVKCLSYGLKQDALFIRGWPGYSKHQQRNIPDTTNLNKLDVAAIPHIRGSEKSAVFGGWNLMISRFSTKKSAALKFIRFALNEQNQKILYSSSGYVPVNNKVRQDSAFMSQNSELTYYYQLMENGRHRPQREDYTQISDIMSYYFHLALKNEITINEALQQSTQKINSGSVFIK